MPSGTASFHFPSRSSLLHGIAARITELDLTDLAAVTEPAADPDGIAPRLAQAVIAALTEPRLTRTKARYEVMLQATRDPQLRDNMRATIAQFMKLSRAAIKQLQPAGTTPDPDLIGDQTYAVMTFLNGVLLGVVCGDRTIRTAAQLNDLLVGIVAGVSEPARESHLPTAFPQPQATEKPKSASPPNRKGRIASKS